MVKHETVEKRKREGGGRRGCENGIGELGRGKTEGETEEGRGEERVREWDRRVREGKKGGKREGDGGEQKRKGRGGIGCENGKGE